MSIPADQGEIAAFLRSLAEGEPVETHISLIFLGADTVWKLKKSVRLPFLDFTRVADRRRFAERELELNAPAAPGLYRDVVPVVRRSDGTLSFCGDPNAALDWVLRMARVPPGDFMNVMAEAGKLDPPLLDAIADAVAAWHAAQPAVQNLVPPMEEIARGNARSARAAGLDESAIASWERAMLAELGKRAGALAARAAAGWVRRGHGDLHLGNLCLWQGRPVLFDALEFDETLATIDVGYDLAFLLMDLDRRVGRAAANRVLNRYVARSGDVGLVAGLPAFLSMRATIRAHVEQRVAHNAAAQDYLTAALLYLNSEPRSIVVAVGGLPGTGKSTLARALAPGLGPTPGALVLRSDEIRKRLFGVAPEQALPQSAYKQDVGRAVFETLAEGTKIAATAGHAVIADATFLDPQHRAMVETAADQAGVRFQGFWLQAPLPELEARIAARAGDASDATIEVVRRAAAANLPPPTESRWIIIDSVDSARVRDLANAALASHVA